MSNIELALTENDQAVGEALVTDQADFQFVVGETRHSVFLTVRRADIAPGAEFMRSHETLSGISAVGSGPMAFGPVFVAVAGGHNLFFSCAMEPAGPDRWTLRYRAEKRGSETLLCAEVSGGSSITAPAKEWFVINGAGEDGRRVTLGVPREQLPQVAHLLHQGCTEQERGNMAAWLIGHGRYTQTSGLEQEQARMIWPAESIEVGEAWGGQVTVAFGLPDGGMATFGLTPQLAEILREALTPGPRGRSRTPSGPAH